MKTGTITLCITLAFAALVKARNENPSDKNVAKRNALEEGVKEAPPSDGELKRRDVEGGRDRRVRTGRKRSRRGGGGRGGRGGRGGNGGNGGKDDPALPVDDLLDVGNLAGGLPAVDKLSGGLPAVDKLSGGLPVADKLSGGLPAVDKLSGGLPAVDKLSGGLPAVDKLSGGLPAVGNGSPLKNTGGSSGSPVEKILGRV